MTEARHREEMQHRHPSRELIQAWLDGQVPAADAAWIRAHCALCAECKVCIMKFQEDWDWLLAVHRGFRLDKSIVENPPIAQFRQRLEDFARKNHKDDKQWSFQRTRSERWWVGLAGFLPSQQASIVLLVAVALVIGVMMVLLNQRASAETVLRRAEKYEVSSRPSSGEVSRSVISVAVSNRGGQETHKLGSVIAVRDSSTTGLHFEVQRTSPPVMTATIYSQSDMGLLAQEAWRGVLDKPMLDYFKVVDCFPDVSVGQFRKLVAQRRAESTQVSLRDGVFELEFPFAAGHASGIREAVLRVEKRTYAPVELILVTGSNRDERDFHFARSSVTLLPRAGEWSKVFSPGASPQTTDETLHSPGRPVPYADSLATAAEVSVARALHESSACLGEEVFVFPMDDGSLLVQGLVDDSLRSGAIRQQLSSLRSTRLTVQIYTPDEVTTNVHLYPPPDGLNETMQRSVVGTTGQPGEMSALNSVPMHDAIYKGAIASGNTAKEAEQRVSKISSAVTDDARAILLNAWALKRLDTEFERRRVQGLSSAALDLIDGMREDHRGSIQKLTTTIVAMIGPIVGSAKFDTPAGHENPQGVGIDDTLQSAQDLDQLVRSLFANSGARTDLNVDLPALEATLHQLQAEVARPQPR